MKVEYLMWLIQERVNMYLVQNKITDSSNIGITISTDNLNKIVDYHYDSINQEKPKIVSSIKIYGYNIIPSDFIQNDFIIIGEFNKLD